MKFYNKYFFAGITMLMLVCFMGQSCKKFVDAGAPIDKLTADKIYNDSTSTLGAVLALYSSGQFNGTLIVNLCQYGAMAADDGYYYNNSTYDAYRTNTLSAGNLGNVLYPGLFQQIYYANNNIERITASAALSTSFKNQLLGECKFMRAYYYFNLINYFGNVPLITSAADVSGNASLGRTSTDDVYKQIIADLTDAKALVSAAYPSAEKARVNRSVVSAFLSRVYLYQKNWTAAEAEASAVINSGTYLLETNLGNVFVKTSNEVIWQVISNVAAGINGVTKMGTAWIPSGTTPVFVLYDTLAKTFETGDQRKVAWTRSLNFNGSTFYYPFKYKIRTVTASGNEYNVMFRLSEQYLIRSEARAMQNNFTGAANDLDAVRLRAGLPKTNAATQAALLSALEHERWVELFTEMSDRWFNLKRTNRIDAVLKLTKPQWQPFQALYPIPLADRNANPNLKDNPGY